MAHFCASSQHFGASYEQWPWSISRHCRPFFRQHFASSQTPKETKTKRPQKVRGTKRANVFRCIFVQALNISGPRMSNGPGPFPGVGDFFSGSVSHQIKHQSKQKRHAPEKCEGRRGLLFLCAFLCKPSTFRGVI